MTKCSFVGELFPHILNILFLFSVGQYAITNNCTMSLRENENNLFYHLFSLRFSFILFPLVKLTEITCAKIKQDMLQNMLQN